MAEAKIVNRRRVTRVPRRVLDRNRVKGTLLSYRGPVLLHRRRCAVAWRKISSTLEAIHDGVDDITDKEIADLRRAQGKGPISVRYAASGAIWTGG